MKGYSIGIQTLRKVHYFLRYAGLYSSLLVMKMNRNNNVKHNHK